MWKRLLRWPMFIKKASHESAAPSPMEQRWDLPTSPTLCWNALETQALLRCEDSTTICTVTDQGRNSPLQTVVLGCDPAANQVLLDDFFPRPASSPLGGRFQLHLPMQDGLLLLDVLVRDEIGVAPTPAYVAEIVNKTTVSDRRLSPRLRFSSALAPRIDLLVPLSPQLRGHLLDLSEDGLAMVHYGATKPTLFAKSGECRIQFDEYFVLRAQVQIQQVKACRKPFHHTVIRIRFNGLTACEKDRLGAFVRDCVANTAGLSAA